MERTRSGTSGSLPWLGILLPLALGFVLSVALAYQAWDARREHRMAAEATVRDHAAFAAHLLASRLDRGMSEAILYAFYGVDLPIRARNARWPAALDLGIEQELDRCGDVRAPDERIFFRWIEGDDLEILGPAHPDLRSWLLGWVPETARRQSEARPWGLRFGAPGIGPEGVAFRIYREAEGTVMFGLDNCFRDLDGDVVEKALAEPGVLPPTLVGDTPNDSLFRLAVVNGEGEAVRGAANRYGGRFRGHAALRPAEVFGGLALEIRLLDDTAERLTAAGLPRSRLPEALAFVALTALLLAVAARQLRRGQELVRLRESFVANVSHELRTPLQQTLLFTDLLRLDRLPDESERKQAISVIHRETRRLIDLVENVLAYSRTSRPETAGMIRVRDTDLLELARSVAESFQPLADERGTRIQVSGEEVVVRADPDALQRVLINLLDNGVKYGPDTQTLRIRVERRGEEGMLRVEDEGQGIPEGEHRRIWEAHARLEREEAHGRSGHGVGLAIVRDLVTRMGGRVWLDNPGDRGARFVVALPASAT